jgi:hypothetical protein
MNELAASTLEGLTDEERRIITERVTFGCTDGEQAVIDAALALAKIPDTVDFREEFESAEYAVWEAARALASSLEGKE